MNMAAEDTEESSTDSIMIGRALAQAGNVWAAPQLAIVPGVLMGAASVPAAAATLASALLAGKRANEQDNPYLLELVKQYGWNSILANNTVDAQRAAVNRFVATGETPVAMKLAKMTNPKIEAMVTADWDSQVKRLAGTKPGQPWWDIKPKLFPEDIAVPKSASRAADITKGIRHATVAVYNPVASTANAIIRPVISSPVRPTSTFKSTLMDSTDAMVASARRADQAKGWLKTTRHGAAAVVHGVQTPLRLARVAAKTAALGILTGAAGAQAGQSLLRLGDDQLAELFNVPTAEVNQYLDTLFSGTGAVDPLTIYARTIDVIYDDLAQSNIEAGLHAEGDHGDFVGDQVEQEIKTTWGSSEPDPLLGELTMVPDEVAEFAGNTAEAIVDTGFYLQNEISDEVDAVTADPLGVETVQDLLNEPEAQVAKNLTSRTVETVANTNPVSRLLWNLAVGD